MIIIKYLEKIKLWVVRPGIEGCVVELVGEVCVDR